MKNRKETLQDLEKETERFLAKLRDAIKCEYRFSSKKVASARRSALDLKNELTNLTQSRYKNW